MLCEEIEALRQRFDGPHKVIYTFRRSRYTTANNIPNGLKKLFITVNDIPISRAEGGQGLWKK